MNREEYIRMHIIPQRINHASTHSADRYLPGKASGMYTHTWSTNHDTGPHSCKGWEHTAQCEDNHPGLKPVNFFFQISTVIKPRKEHMAFLSSNKFAKTVIRTMIIHSNINLLFP